MGIPGDVGPPGTPGIEGPQGEMGLNGLLVSKSFQTKWASR